MSPAFVPPAECPVCGETVPRGARACPGCGADERSGWNEDDTRYDGLDLPADAFEDAPARPRRRWDKLWFATIIILLVAIGLTFVFR